MRRLLSRPAAWVALGLLLVSAVVVFAVVVWIVEGDLPFRDSGDAALARFVASRPPVPIVFTSRTEPASLVARAPEGEVYTYPGQQLWHAREGRLRLLTPHGAVHELTWGKILADGSTLIDVMSPSVSADGKKIVFAGRKGGADAGHFRLYEIGVDGSELRPLTGGADDEGCVAAPPLRFAADGSLLALDERRRVDYDDVDPVHHPDGRILFISSRAPDLGRAPTARRATQLWIMNADGSGRFPLTANRYNDRWAWVLHSGFVGFSLWSHNQEVISADGRDIRPYQDGGAFLMSPPDSWLGAIIEPTSSRFSGLVKTPFPVWRLRPLFNGRAAFMTDWQYPAGKEDAGMVLSVVQTQTGLIQNAPSCRQPTQALPRQGEIRYYRGPNRDGEGRPLSAATPSPCPPDGVLLTAAPVEAGLVRPQRYGVYWAEQDWPSASDTVTAASVNLRLIFDDPDLVDAEPVAVYVRDMPFGAFQPAYTGETPARSKLELRGGRSYQGPVGSLFNGSLYAVQNEHSPGQLTDRGQGPIFDSPPRDSIAEIRVYASYRDRFDSPDRPRVPGDWAEIFRHSMQDGQGKWIDNFSMLLPVGTPMVMAGFDREGRVARWTTSAKDSEGRQATFFAIAGDHYSGVRTAHRDFCVGCHPGHSGPGKINHGERLK